MTRNAVMWMRFTVVFVVAALGGPRAAWARPAAACDVLQDVTQSDDVRISALIALAQMNPERGRATIERVLQRRDDNSVCLRQVAVLLLAQQHADGTETIFLDVVRNDPNPDVRKQAVVHLTQAGTDRAIAALDSIASTTADSDVAKLAVGALLQSDSARAKAALRTYGQRPDLSLETAQTIVTRLLRDDSPENAIFLRQAYGRLDRSDPLRVEVVRAVARVKDSTNTSWLLAIAADSLETTEFRSEALTLAADVAPAGTLMSLYTPALPDALRANLLDVYVKRTDAAMLDALAAMAKQDPNMALRKAAVSHIAQSSDPHAAEVLQAILNEP